MDIAEVGNEKKLNDEIKSWARSSSLVNSLYLTNVQNLTFDDFIANKLFIVVLIREGISYSFFRAVQDISPFPQSYWADLLDITPSALLSYKKTEKHFKPAQAEKIIEMAEVSHLGLEVFGNMEKFKLWMETPSYALGNMKPMELLKDSYGKDLVISELNRINYGIFV
jgi:putative toxin-antitoxin system antitoxin component (TIGR02293 family)